jgi:hypothetical protein
MLCAGGCSISCDMTLHLGHLVYRKERGRRRLLNIMVPRLVSTHRISESLLCSVCRNQDPFLGRNVVCPKVGQVARTVPSPHEVDIATLGIDTHLMPSTMAWAILNDGLVRVMVVMKTVPVAVGLEPLPDRFVVVGTDVFVK